MLVKDILEAKGRDVRFVRPHDKLDAVVQRLRTERIGALIVKAVDDSVAGILSERDVVRCLADHGPGLIDMTVSALMTEDPVTCTPDDTVAKVAQTMTDRRIRHIPVMADGKLLGMISIGDVVKNRLEEMKLERNVLMDIAIANR